MLVARGLCYVGAVLTLLWVAGPVAAQSADNPLGLCGGSAVKGSLMLCGGGRIPEEVYEEFLRLAGGKNAHIVHIPSAHSFSSPEAIRFRYNGWLSYDVASFTFLDAPSREEADTEQFAAPLEQATGVWIGGGSQGRLASLYAGTKVEKALKKVLERGGVIGGTSAGASVMSSTMIRYGSSTEAVTDTGLCLIEHAVVDQHFAERSRLERLLGVLEEHRSQIGLGIDEGTAVVVQADRLRVLGKSRATICVPNPGGEGILLYRLRSGEEARVQLASDQSAGGRLQWAFERFASKK